MANLIYRKGDATRPVGSENKIICHIVNNIGAWGAGFVVSISEKFPEAEESYRRLDSRCLGMVQYIHVAGENIITANMIAQKGIYNKKLGITGDLVDYNALTTCLDNIFKYA